MADTIMSLVEAAKAEAPSTKTGYIGIYANAYQPNYVAPVQKSGRVWDWTVEDSLPHTGSSSSRAIGSDFDATQANFKPYESKVKAYGGKIKVDRYIKYNMPESMPRQQESQIKAFARSAFIDTFEGTGGSAMRGIRHWLGGDATTYSALAIAPGYENQIVSAGATSGGVAISLDMLDEAISKVDVRPGKTFIYANFVLVRGIQKLNRGNVSAGHNVVFDPSQIGTFSMVYDNIPIVQTTDGKNADLLSTTEYDYSNGVQTTMSLYIVTWDDDAATYFSTNPQGISGVPLPILDNDGDGSNYQYERFEFYVGFVPQIPRSVVRLMNLKNALPS